MKKNITLAAYLAGATTLAVSLPAMADRYNDVPFQDGAKITVDAEKMLKTDDKA
jgi:hypothetical protein